MIKQIDYTKQLGENIIEYIFLFDGDKLTDEEATKCVQTDKYTHYGFAIYKEHADLVTKLIKQILHDKGKALVDRKSLEAYMQYALCKCQGCDNDYVCGDTEQRIDNQYEFYQAEIALEKALAQ